MNLEHICYGCFQEKPDEASVCPRCGFCAEEEKPFLALPMGTLLEWPLHDWQGTGRGRIRHYLSVL